MKSAPSALYTGIGVALIVLGITLAIVLADTTQARVFLSAVAVLGVVLAAYGVLKRTNTEDPDAVTDEH